MQLFLIQHGEPVPESVDPEKPLSPKGTADVKKTAAFLKKSGAVIKTVFHSDKKRAIQTAQILSEVLSDGCRAVQRDDLSPNDPIEGILKDISKQSEDIAIAGHLPFLVKLSAKLVTDQEDQPILQFKQGGVACLVGQEGAWKVCWLVIPDLLQKQN